MSLQETSLSDTFGRQIDYLRVSITDRCNLKCVYCIPDRGLKYFKQSEILTSEEIIRFVSIAHKYGVRKVRLTGGEPLLREGIIELISAISSLGVPDLSITTNGVRLSEMSAILKKAGLRRLNISLDTLNPERYRVMTRGGDIERIWSAIRSAEKVGLYPIKINVVPICGLNDDEVLDFASLTFDKDYHIRFIEFMPIGPSRVWSERACIRKEEIIEIISKLGRLTPLPFRGKGPSRNYKLNGAKGVIGIISPLSDCFCDFCNRLRLTADGKLKPCLFSDVEVDIKTPMRNRADDRELERLFLKAASLKPEGHYLDKGMPLTLSSMSKIGG